MSGLHFSNSYRTILSIGRNFGLPLPFYDDNDPAKIPILHTIYEVSMAIFLIFKIACGIYTITHNQKFDEVVYSFALTIFYAFGFFLLIFYAYRGSGFVALISDLDKLTERLQDSGFGEQEYFSRLHETDSTQLTMFIRVMCASSVICPFFFCLSVPAFGLIEGDYRLKVAVPTQCPFELHIPVLYEVIIFHQFLGLALPGVQKLGHECIVIALFKIHGSYFKYLSVTLRRLGNELALDEDGAHKKFRSWLKLHQAVVRSSANIIEFYSPVIITYLLSITGMVAASVFYLINAPDANLIQSGFLGAYMFITMFRLFLQCFMAQELSSQASNIADEIYNIPWYDFKKAYNEEIKLVLTLAIHPFYVEAYRAPGFRLDVNSFQSFFTSTVSAFLAFNKMIEHDDE
uniref:Odorant receptor n=1 Tax=Yemma signatus TaxID=300820 RepID=A0A385H532_9HEMI|nr:odorant receptor [Yemma signatus]